MIKVSRFLIWPVSMALFLQITAVSYLCTTQAQPQASKYEFRAPWLTTAWGLDWPAGVSGASSQQNRMISILDRLVEQNMSAVIFQVSARGDAYYQSDRLPWAYNLSGTPGNDPGWDPLQFVIDEARKRGLEVHAWFNAFAVAYDSGNDAPASADIPNVRHTNPGWMESGGWMNPGIPEARQWQVDNVMELVERYDIDAIHFDRIRYASGYTRDPSLMEAHNPDSIANIADWRRWNVTEFVRQVHEGIQEIRPTVKIGVTPVGHYDAGSTAGWGALYGYSSVFQDSRFWAEMGYIDYIAPQVYWDIGTVRAPRFVHIVNDWVVKRRNDRHLYIGIGAHETWNRNEMDLQIDTTRSLGAEGQVYFRNASISGSDFNGRYDTRAIVPPMPWRSLSQPNPVRNLAHDIEENRVTLSWEEPTPGRGEEDPLFRYVVYRVNTGSIISDQAILDNPVNIATLTGETNWTEEITGEDELFELTYYVTALSRNNVEGDFVRADLTLVSADEPAMIAGRFELKQNYPNPFNPETRISFHLPETAHTTLAIYDLLGRRVAMLTSDVMAAGQHSVTFDASGLASGVYVYRLRSGDHVQSKKMLLGK